MFARVLQKCAKKTNHQELSFNPMRWHHPMYIVDFYYTQVILNCYKIFFEYVHEEKKRTSIYFPLT